MRRRDLNQKDPRTFGNKREELLAKRGYTRTPNSGASGVKGDFRRGDYMIEMKATKHDSFRVDANIMGKLRNDGLTNGKRGILIVEIGTGEKFAVMPLTTFEHLVPEDAD